MKNNLKHKHKNNYLKKEIYKLAALGIVLIFGIFVTVIIMSSRRDSATAAGCPGTQNITINTSWNSNQCLGDVTISNNATLTISGNTTHDLVSLTLGDGISNGYIIANGDTVSGNGITINTDGNIEVKSGSYISAEGKGYTSTNGPGGSSDNTIGASHGGLGYGSLTDNSYGSIVAPTTLGSAGVNSGGGAIKLAINGNLVNNGSITASATPVCSGCGGSRGAGGSVWVNFTGGSSSWSGNGTIYSLGGASYNYSGSTAGGGGGGRIAVTNYVSDTHSGSVLTYADKYASNGRVGASGTVYLKSTSQSYGTVIVDNNGNLPYGGSYTPLLKAGESIYEQIYIRNYGFVKLPTSQTSTIASVTNLTSQNNGYLTIDPGASLTFASGSTFTHAAGGLVTNNGTLNTSAITYTVNGTLTTHQAATNTLSDVVVGSTGAITHPANTTTEQYRLDLTMNNLTIDSGGKVDVEGKGYTSTNGPGGSSDNTIGASHGGLGYGSLTDNSYGSIVAPTTLGSAGVNSGGGAIKLAINGNLVNNGSITASATPVCSGCGGSRGAGGSVWVNFTGGSSSWSGNGTIYSLGGASYNYSGSTAGGGGGGRIAVTNYVSDTHSGSVLTYADKYASNGRVGASGTVYLKSTSQSYGTVIVDNNGNLPYGGSYTPLLKAGESIYEQIYIRNYGFVKLPTSQTSTIASVTNLTSQNNGYLTIDPGASLTFASGSTFTHAAGGLVTNNGTLNTSAITYTVNGTLTTHQAATNTLSDVVVGSTGAITHPANTTTEQYRLDLTMNNLTIDSGGKVDVEGKGYTSTNGPGGSSDNTIGASHGGLGYGSLTDNSYGSIVAPTTLGSAGVNSGGGAIKLAINGNLVNNGSITASATPVCSGCGGSRGAGGSVWVNFTGGSSSWSGNGTIYSLGGASYNYSGSTAGGGGGGRIAVTNYVSDTHSGSVLTYADKYASNGRVGASGTVYLKSTSQSYGTVIVDNNGNLPDGGSYTPLLSATNINITLDSLQVKNSAVLEIPAGRTLTLSAGGTATHNTNSNTLISGNYATSGGTINLSNATITQNNNIQQTWGEVVVGSGGILRHSANTTLELYKLNFAANNLTINSGGLIDANGAGYSGGAIGLAGNGTGGGGLGGTNSAGGGGGYGGVGAAGAGAEGGSAGATYGSQTSPSNLGSGGGGGANSSGGAGGGAIIISIAGNLVNAGTIRANGANGSAGTYGGGAGSGGTINISTNNFNCTSGSLTANGGSGGGSVLGGNGGGGRIARFVGGAYTSCTSIASNPNGTNYNIVAPPVSFVGINPSVSSITWQWVDNSTNETEFIVYKSDNTLVGVVPSTTTASVGTIYTLTETGLNANESYTRYVRASDGIGESSTSNIYSENTLANSTPNPDTPSNTNSQPSPSSNPNQTTDDETSSDQQQENFNEFFEQYVPSETGNSDEPLKRVGNTIPQGIINQFKTFLAQSIPVRQAPLIILYLYSLLAILAARFIIQARREITTTNKINTLVVQTQNNREQLKNMAMVVSHYLNTPLAIIKGSVESLRPSAGLNSSVINKLKEQTASLGVRVSAFANRVNAKVILTSPPDADIKPISRLKLYSQPAVFVPMAITAIISSALFLGYTSLEVGTVSTSQIIIYSFLFIFSLQLIAESYRFAQLHDQKQRALRVVQRSEDALSKTQSDFLTASYAPIESNLSNLGRLTSSSQLTGSTKLTDGVKRLKSLVERLDVITELNNPGTKFKLTKLNLYRTLHPLIDEYDAKFKQAGGNLNINANHNINIKGDATAITQVISSILDNSLTYKNPNTALITQIKAYARGGNTIIRISDNGIGISKSKQAKLFTPFARGTSTTTFDYEGHGLSLYIAKLIMEKLDGAISISSDGQKGTTVELKFKKMK